MSKIITFEPWIGEFGWELMAWQARCRKIARDYDKAVTCSFEGMEALYKDFSEFLTHDRPNRSVGFPHKDYRVGGEFIKFGSPKRVKDILIHARGCGRSSFKNYKNWSKVKLDAGWIGTGQDLFFGDDLRDLDLQDLMDIIAGAKVVIGGSSGVMHLASLCGTPLVVWGDDRTYFGETLENRYKETWNPFGVEVEWLNGWQPKASEIESKAGRFV